MADINKAGVLIIKDSNFLVCRKKDETSKLIMPGGSIEMGENPEECVAREVHEELGDEVELSELRYVGTYEDSAAYDDPSIKKTVQIILYRGKIKGEPIPSSEIAELIWFNPQLNKNELSPIIKNKILPDLVRRNILKW